MELKQFISETLTQILSGIADAQSTAKSHGGQVNPALLPIHPGPIEGSIRDGAGTVAQIISFDVAVTVSEGTATKGGIGVVTGLISLGSAGSSQDSSTTVSRIKFNVPLVLPTQT